MTYFDSFHDDMYYKDIFSKQCSISDANSIIPFLAEILLEEDDSVVEKLYKELTAKEREFIFNRSKIPLKQSIGIERSILKKLSECRRKKKNN